MQNFNQFLALLDEVLNLITKRHAIYVKIILESNDSSDEE